MMEEGVDGIQLVGFVFTANFDSANLAKVELVPKSITTFTTTVNNAPVKKPASTSAPRASLKPSKPVPVTEVVDFEFNLWTRPDCHGTQYENTNRTWFHFGVRGGPPFSLVKLNLIDLNKQGRMYRDGMAPVFRVCPGRSWERVRDKPVYTVQDNVFTLSFKFRTLESPKATIYFAFTYPFSYMDLQNHLGAVDARLSKPGALFPKTDTRFIKGFKIALEAEDKIYYHREVACYSMEGRRVDLLTISSHHNITCDQEPRLANLFPDNMVPRCLRFQNKKVVLMSARVHPGETPSSFVLNGLLNLLLSRDDPIALLLRRKFVFKLIPMLNPDGVARGHYRTDTRGVNLNRFYLNPDVRQQPSIYAARALIRFYHYEREVPDDDVELMAAGRASQSDGSSSSDPLTSSTETLPMQELSIQSSHSSLSSETDAPRSDKLMRTPIEVGEGDSGLYLYMDMHGHASKKGIFMYGNHFSRTEDSVECMLLPKLMSLNSQNFHFPACNFTERNMYLRDKRDGTSREGSGRVAVLRLTGLVRSYTLECNYNTGRVVNSLPQCAHELPGKPVATLLSPPKYTPNVYEEVGRAIGVSILDMTNSNPWSRVPCSEHHSMAGVREWLRLKSLSETFTQTRAPLAQPRPKRNSQVIIVRPPRATAKASAGVRLGPLPNKPLDTPVGEWEAKDVPLRPSMICNFKSTRSVKPKHSCRTPEEEDKKMAIGVQCVEATAKIKSACGEPSSFKQSPKRLKMCKADADRRKTLGESSLELAVASTEGCLPSTGKKRLLKSRTQLSPLKHKKSLEKRRNGDKKTKILYKKASKLALGSSDSVKSDRKRRNVLPMIET